MPPEAVLRPPIRATSFSYLVLGEHMRSSGQRGVKQPERRTSNQRGVKQPERRTSSQRGVRTVREASGRSKRRQSSQRGIKQPERRQSSQRGIKQPERRKDRRRRGGALARKRHRPAYKDRGRFSAQGGKGTIRQSTMVKSHRRTKRVNRNRNHRMRWAYDKGTKSTSGRKLTIRQNTHGQRGEAPTIKCEAKNLDKRSRRCYHRCCHIDLTI